MSSSRRATIGLTIAALLLGVGALVAVIHGQHNIHRGAYAALALGIGWGFIWTGLYSWTQRPASNIGPLMIAVGFAGLLKALAFSGDSIIFTIGSLSEVLIYALLIHLLLSFPSGRLESGVDRLLVAVAYFNATVVQLTAFLLNDPAKAGCPGCPANPVLVDHSQAAAGVIDAAQLDIAVAVLGAVVAVLYRRWRDSTTSQQRGLAPVLAVGGLTFGLLMAELIVEQADLSSKVADGLTLALFGSLVCLPIAFLAGLVRFRFSQAEAISSLVGRLGAGAGRVSLRDAIAEALRDPTLQLAYWVPKQEAYVDSDGQPVRIEPPPRGKIATTVENKGRRVGAIVHADRPEERDLVRAVGAAAALTLENERLDAEVRARVEELQTSRARIVTAGDAERRRLERDLHDGAQQRLMALGINLRLARHLVASDADAAALLDASLEELNEATRELRELARGIHPAVLTERGLQTALNGLAVRSPVPVELVETPEARLPSSVESAVYFVVAEALTNVARYAQARTAKVRVSRRNGQVDVQVSDDGVGGADPAQGSGLRGLSDRVAALDGRLVLTSPAGDGTTVRARIPCG